MVNIFLLIRNIILVFKVFQYYSAKAALKAVFAGNSSLGHQFWAILAFEYFKVKLHEFRGQQLREQKTIFLVNHRSQADFFIHNIIMNFKGNILSRLAVAIVFPVFGICANDTVWFFNRSGNINVDKFNQWLDEKFEKSCRPSLLVYPEGHRMPGSEKVDKSKLRTGLIRYAYRKQIPTQIVISFGNEKVFNQKKMHMSWGQTVYYRISETYDPTKYESENEFVEAMKDRFCEQFDETYELYQNELNDK